MKPLGFIRRMDDLGRITIPIELRQILGIEKDTPMEFFATEHGIYIRAYNPGEPTPKDDKIEAVEM